MKVVPTIGDTVLYQSTEEDLKWMREQPDCNEAAVLPAVIVADWGSCVNLKVITDGNQDLWKTSIQQGVNPGEWKMLPTV